MKESTYRCFKYVRFVNVPGARSAMALSLKSLKIHVKYMKKIRLKTSIK
jgi:hypothetical protein